MAPEAFRQRVQAAEQRLSAKCDLTFIGSTATGELVAVLIDESYIMHGFMAPNSNPHDTELYDAIAGEPTIDYSAQTTRGRSWSLGIEIPGGATDKGEGITHKVTIDNGFYFLDGQEVKALETEALQ